MTRWFASQSLDLVRDERRPPGAVFDVQRAERLAALGMGVLRYGLVGLLLLWGALKFTQLEAQAIRPLLEHHPVMNLLLLALGMRGASAAIGVVELCAAALIALHRLRPVLSALGSLLAAVTFIITLSFLITTPNVLAFDNPFGGFLMKDIILLGASLATAADALRAAQKRDARSTWRTPPP